MWEQILKKAIEKAIKGGYNKTAVYNEQKSRIETTGRTVEVYCFIYSHEFAKAFWGEKCGKCETNLEIWDIKDSAAANSPTTKILTCPKCMEAPPSKILWRDRLQQMVLEKDPLKYIEKFL